MYEVSSKTMDGITDLVVVAPIKKGFIEAYENVTYATRLKLVAEALNRVRVSAREHERVVPFSDVTERILNLLDFRVGVLDKDTFGLIDKVRRPDGEGFVKALESRRYLYLTATFEGGWEPYMRLIWKPLGSFLDLLFCNCEGYVTATEHGCEEYLQWVRDNQMDSAIFYAVTGLTTRDGRYLSRLERLQRDGAGDLQLAKFTMPYPDPEAEASRLKHLRKTVELGFEAMTVLYKLADYYPPEWLTGKTSEDGLLEGHRLLRAGAEILQGWQQVTAIMDAQPEPIRSAWLRAKETYAEPLDWFNTGLAHVKKLDAQAANAIRPDPTFAAEQVQGGILERKGEARPMIRQGALLLFTIRNTAAARAFVGQLDPHFAAGSGSAVTDGMYRTVGFTHHGLLRLGVNYNVVDRFPKEFRDGMAARSGILGDMRENHPRNWILPTRNGPALTSPDMAGAKLPPVELDEVDIAVQVRTTEGNPEKLLAEIRRLAELGGTDVTLEAYELMSSGYDPATGLFRDHFGFLDGISQPVARVPDAPDVPERDRVRPGEILVGYGNDRGDSAPGAFSTLEGKVSVNGQVVDGPLAWRAPHRKAAQDLQRNGSFLVVRKIGEEVDAFNGWLVSQAGPIAAALGCSHDEARLRLKAAIMGRDENGQPLTGAPAGKPNDFDYGGDPDGVKCPFSAHIRRANPRRTEAAGKPHNTQREHGRPTPRILRRGMLFGGTASGPRGLMFMAYNASIAEQYEVIQRWLNGGNSTDVASWNNDVLTGVQPRNTDGSAKPPSFSFVARDTGGNEHVLHIPLPPVAPAGTSEPGRHPFTPLHWGLYLFVPSRDGLKSLVAETGEFKPMRDPLEDAVGQEWIDRLATLKPEEAGEEWKRLLEDFVAKDPSEADISPNLWAAIRNQYGGVLSLRDLTGVTGPLPPPAGLAKSSKAAPAKQEVPKHDWVKPNPKAQNLVLCAGRSQVRQVLHDWRNFSNEEALRRMKDKSGPLYVTQQPDNIYRNPALNGQGYHYRDESFATNNIILDPDNKWGFDEAWGFQTGYAAARAVLDTARDGARAAGRDYYKIELRRQFLFPALGGLFANWYGIPDGKHFKLGGWSWKKLVTSLAEGETLAERRTEVFCPGDFLAPSRATFYPRPSPTVEWLGTSHGQAILQASTNFVKEHRQTNRKPQGAIARAMFEAEPAIADHVLARNLVGTMVGGIPPMEANLRGVIAEWIIEKSLWRQQAALHRAMAGKKIDPGVDLDVATALTAMRGPVTRALCKRPAPDLMFRTALGPATIKVNSHSKRVYGRRDVEVKEGDLVVISQVSAAQRSLISPSDDLPDGDVSTIFGGRRDCADQIETADDHYPVHACPAQKSAMGAMQGILAALLDAGRVQVLPASLIVRISDW